MATCYFTIHPELRYEYITEMPVADFSVVDLSNLSTYHSLSIKLHEMSNNYFVYRFSLFVFQWYILILYEW